MPPRPTRTEMIKPFGEHPQQGMNMTMNLCDNAPSNGQVYPSAPVASLEWKVLCTQSIELVNVEVSLLALREVFTSSAALLPSGGAEAASAASSAPDQLQFATLCLTVTPEIQYTSYDSYAAVPFDVILARFDQEEIMAADEVRCARVTTVQQQFEGPVTVTLSVKVYNTIYERSGFAELLSRVGPLMGAATARLTDGEMPRATQWRPVIYRRWFEVKDPPSTGSPIDEVRAGDFGATISFPPTNPFYREHRAKQSNEKLRRLVDAAAAAGAAEAAMTADAEAADDGGLLPLTSGEKKKKKGTRTPAKEKAGKGNAVAEEAPSTVAVSQPPTGSTAAAPSRFRLVSGAVAEVRAVSTCGRVVRWARSSTLRKAPEANFMCDQVDAECVYQGHHSTQTAGGRAIVVEGRAGNPFFCPVDYDAIGGGETPMCQVQLYSRRLVAPTHNEAGIAHVEAPPGVDCRSVLLYPHLGASRLQPLERGEAREAIALIPTGQSLFVLWADPASDHQLATLAHKRSPAHPVRTSHFHADGGELLRNSAYFTAPATATPQSRKAGKKLAEVVEEEAPELIPADEAPSEQDPHSLCGPDAYGRGWSVIATVGWSPASDVAVVSLGDIEHKPPVAPPTKNENAATAPRVEGESSHTIITTRPLSPEQIAAQQESAAASIVVSSEDSRHRPYLVEYFIQQHLHRTIAFFAPSSLTFNEATLGVASTWPSAQIASAHTTKLSRVVLPRVGDIRVLAAPAAAGEQLAHLNNFAAFVKAGQDLHETDLSDNNARRFRFFRGVERDVMIARTDAPSIAKDEWSTRRLMDWNEVRPAVAVHIGSVRSTGFDMDAYIASQDKSKTPTDGSKDRGSSEEDNAAAVDLPLTSSTSRRRSASTKKNSESPIPHTPLTSGAVTQELFPAVTAEADHSGSGGPVDEKAVVFVQWADGTFSCASSPAGLHLMEINPVQPKDVEFTAQMPLSEGGVVDEVVDGRKLDKAVRLDRAGLLRTPLMVRRSTSPEVIDLAVQETVWNRKKQEIKKRKQKADNKGAKGNKKEKKRGGGWDHHHHRDDEPSSEEEDDDSSESSTFSLRREREAQRGGIIDGFMMPPSLRDRLKKGSVPVSELPEIDLGGAEKKAGKYQKRPHHHRHNDAEDEEEWEGEGSDNDAYDFGGGGGSSFTDDDDEEGSYDDSYTADTDGMEEQSWTEEGTHSEGYSVDTGNTDATVGSSAFDTEYDYDSAYNSSDVFDDGDVSEGRNYRDGQLSDEAYSYEEGWSSEPEEEDEDLIAPATGSKRPRGVTSKARGAGAVAKSTKKSAPKKTKGAEAKKASAPKKALGGDKKIAVPKKAAASPSTGKGTPQRSKAPVAKAAAKKPSQKKARNKDDNEDGDEPLAVKGRKVEAKARRASASSAASAKETKPAKKGSKDSKPPKKGGKDSTKKK